MAKIIDKKLLHDGFVYLRSRIRGAKTYWDCNRLRRGECTARAVTSVHGDEVLVLRVASSNGDTDSPHTHPPNQEEMLAEEVKHSMKRKATENPEQPPAQIIRTHLSDINLAVISELPERPNLAKSLRNVRRRDLPPNPTTLEDLVEIPERFTKTLAGDPFMLCDSVINEGQQNEGRVIAFATRRNLEILARSRTWFVDGTFKVSPAIFTQLFTILGLVAKNPRHLGAPTEFVALPFIYAFLSSKEQVQYTKVLRCVAESATEYGIQNCAPAQIMGDFEKAIINACEAVFPNVTYSGCFFHFCQSVYRKIQEVGLQQQYNDPENRQIKLVTHMLMALAYVPPCDVRRIFDSLFENEMVPDELEPVFAYLEENYIVGKPARGRRRAVPPRYPIELWNCYEAARIGSHRTNNISEGWHNRFRLLVGKNHPDLYSIMKQIQQEQGDSEKMNAELSLGRKVKIAPKKKWTDMQQRIQSIVLTYENYNEDNVTEYLKLLSYNISL